MRNKTSAAEMIRRRREDNYSSGNAYWALYLAKRSGQTANCLWSLIFFCRLAYGFAFIRILILMWFVLWMYYLFRVVDPLAAKLQIPLIIWLIFAAILNLAIWYLNS